MLHCELMKNNKCVCARPCVKLIWYEQGKADREYDAVELGKQIRADAIDELMENLEQLLCENLIYQKAEEIAERLKGQTE